MASVNAGRQSVPFRRLFVISASVGLIIFAQTPALAISGVATPVLVSPSGQTGYTEATIVSDPTNGSNLFAGSNLGPENCASPQAVQGFRSSNGGSTWSAASSPPLRMTGDYSVDPAPAYVKHGLKVPSFPRSQIPHPEEASSQIHGLKFPRPGVQEAGLGAGVEKAPARFLSLSR